MQRPQLFLRCIRDMDPSGDVCFENTGMTMTKKQVSKFLTVLTRVEALEKELEPEASTRATPMDQASGQSADGLSAVCISRDILKNGCRLSGTATMTPFLGLRPSLAR
jgi:hypothetical protein